MAFREYHLIWLSAHPWRTEQWLKERLADGFDIHHIDGDAENNAHENLVLIDHADHMMLHANPRNQMRIMGRFKRKPVEKPLYDEPIGPMYHWRFAGRVPKRFTIEFHEQMRQRIAKRFPNSKVALALHASRELAPPPIT